MRYAGDTLISSILLGEMRGRGWRGNGVCYLWFTRNLGLVGPTWYMPLSATCQVPSRRLALPCHHCHFSLIPSSLIAILIAKIMPSWHTFRSQNLRFAFYLHVFGEMKLARSYLPCTHNVPVHKSHTNLLQHCPNLFSKIASSSQPATTNISYTGSPSIQNHNKLLFLLQFIL